MPEDVVETLRAMSEEEIAERAAASRDSTPEEIADRLANERRARAEAAAARHRLDRHR
jgi:hypothetical protein